MIRQGSSSLGTETRSFIFLFAVYIPAYIEPVVKAVLPLLESSG
jgi:hypothetical protein